MHAQAPGVPADTSLMRLLLGCLLTPVFLVVWLLLLYVFHAAQVIARIGFGAKAHRLSVDLLNFSLTHSL